MNRRRPLPAATPVPAYVARTTRAAATTATRALLIWSVLVCPGLVACSSPAPPAFNPGGPASTAPATAAPSAGPGSVIMPPFGQNAHVVITGWRPGNAGLAGAVLADKDYELAYLYAEYTGGRDSSWTSYVSQTMELQVRGVLSGQDVTTESFQGTIRIFDMSAIRDPAVPADVDVSACFDNAAAANTNLSTGAVLPGQSPSDRNYYRYTDQLAQTPSGRWQVVSDYPLVYYPRAKECKP
jgi:hypothetical protein